LLPVQQELINELSGLLGLLTLHKAGIHANLSLNAKRTIRLTPALNIPEAVLDQMLDRVELCADHRSWAWEMLIGIQPTTLLGLSRLAIAG
jgi:hypothetical protein